MLQNMVFLNEDGEYLFLALKNHQHYQNIYQNTTKQDIVESKGIIGKAFPASTILKK